MEALLSELGPIEITGYFSPFHRNDQPWLVQMQDSSDYWLLIFSSVNALEYHCEKMGMTEYKIKHIDDGFDFIQSVREGGVRIMANPYFINGKTRWTEVLLEN